MHQSLAVGSGKVWLAASSTSRPCPPRVCDITFPGCMVARHQFRNMSHLGLCLLFVRLVVFLLCFRLVLHLLWWGLRLMRRLLRSLRRPAAPLGRLRWLVLCHRLVPRSLLLLFRFLLLALPGLVIPHLGSRDSLVSCKHTGSRASADESLYICTCCSSSWSCCSCAAGGAPGLRTPAHSDTTRRHLLRQHTSSRESMQSGARALMQGPARAPEWRGS